MLILFYVSHTRVRAQMNDDIINPLLIATDLINDNAILSIKNKQQQQQQHIESLEISKTIKVDRQNISVNVADDAKKNVHVKPIVNGTVTDDYYDHRTTFYKNDDVNNASSYTSSSSSSSEKNKKLTDTADGGLYLEAGPPPEIGFVPKSYVQKSKDIMAERVRKLESSQRLLSPIEIPTGAVRIFPTLSVSSSHYNHHHHQHNRSTTIAEDSKTDRSYIRQSTSGRSGEIAIFGR